MIADQVVHWWKDDQNNQQKTTLQLETIPPAINGNGYPKDGYITLRIMNGHSVAFRLTPDEALRLGTQLLSIAREQLTTKRKMWENLTR